jgi:hypothetical protein
MILEFLGEICQQQNIPDNSIFYGNEKVVDIFLKIQESPSSITK